MNYDTTVVIRSRAQCVKCGNIIESRHRHDFVSCSCGTIFLDGGLDYIRCGFKDRTDIVMMTETRPKTREEVLEDIKRYETYWGDWGKMTTSAREYLQSLGDIDYKINYNDQK